MEERYYDYATGSDVPRYPLLVGQKLEQQSMNNPTFEQGPAIVTEAGGLSPFGTMAQSGNVFELQESFPRVTETASVNVWYRRGTWGTNVEGISVQSREGQVPKALSRHSAFASRCFRMWLLYQLATSAWTRSYWVMTSISFRGRSRWRSTPPFRPQRRRLVDLADHRYWVEQIAGTRFGDADLNGSVQFADFLQLSANFGQQLVGEVATLMETESPSSPTSCCVGQLRQDRGARRSRTDCRIACAIAFRCFWCIPSPKISGLLSSFAARLVIRAGFFYALAPYGSPLAPYHRSE